MFNLESSNIFYVLFHEQKNSLTVILVLDTFITEQYVLELAKASKTSHDLQDSVVKLNYMFSSIIYICHGEKSNNSNKNDHG